MVATIAEIDQKNNCISGEIEMNEWIYNALGVGMSVLCLVIIIMLIFMFGYMCKTAIEDCINNRNRKISKTNQEYKKAFILLRQKIYEGWYENPEQTVTFEDMKKVVDFIETTVVKGKKYES